MGRTCSRADDEALLDMLAARSAGVSSYDIGRQIGMTGEAVRIATNRVRDADLAESGEADACFAYWDISPSPRRAKRAA